jgi:hypothetical protein
LEKGSDFIEGAIFREAVMPKISASLILIRIADPLKGAKFILSVTIRIMLVSDITPFSLIKFVFS